ncbi:hypothetical protein ACHAW6_000577 [Cyclotella cf. meneghiniana]
MSNTSSKSFDAEDPVVIQPTKAALRGDIDGLGRFLFQMHSIHYVPILFAEEETTLQFYEHVVIGVITTKLWCFPKSSITIVIPRFKIIDASFTFGPRGVPLLVYLLLLIAIVLIGVGSANGGCPSGGCGSLVIGCLMLIIALLLLFLPFCFKKHHVYLDVKTSLRTGIYRRSITYDFRFKKIGFEHATYNKAAFDDMHLVNYVFGTLGNHGSEAMSRYHLLSHFHQVDLANPILPFHADNSVRELLALEMAERLAPSAVVDSMSSGQVDIPSLRQYPNGHHRKRQQISVSV